MNDEPKPTSANPFPLPPGVKLHRHIFGNLSLTVFVEAPMIGEPGRTSPPHSPFTLRWEDEKLGVKVIVHEQPNGRLISDVFSRDRSHLDKAAVAVGLIGSLPTEEMNHICKVIPLTVAEKEGCSGSKDFGLLSDAVEQLGPKLAVIVTLLV